MQELRKKMVSKRPPMPKFDDNWNMEIWAWVTRRFQPVANKNEIVKNLSKEFWIIFVPFSEYYGLQQLLNKVLPKAFYAKFFNLK